MFIYQHLPKGACLNGWCIIGTSYHPDSIPTRKVDPIYYRILESLVNG